MAIEILILKRPLRGKSDCRLKLNQCLLLCFDWQPSLLVFQDSYQVKESSETCVAFYRGKVTGAILKFTTGSTPHPHPSRPFKGLLPEKIRVTLHHTDNSSLLLKSNKNSILAGSNSESKINIIVFARDFQNLIDCM